MSFIGLSCIFPVPNIQETSKFYETCLGFKSVAYLSCEEPHICLYKGQIEIILLQANTKQIWPHRKLYGYGYDAYLYTEDQEALEKEFLAHGVKIVRPLSITDYENQEFVIEDLDGRWLAFGAKVKE